MMKHRDSMNNGISLPDVVKATRKSLKSAESNVPKTLVTFVTTNKSSSSDYCSDYFSGCDYGNDIVSISSSDTDTDKKTRNKNSPVRGKFNQNKSTNNKESIGLKYSYVSSYYPKTIEDRSVSTEDIMYFSRYELDQKLDWTSNDSQSNTNTNSNP